MGLRESEPLVTIVMPAYNHERYILESLEGIANQTYKNIQWIVTDDSSKDRTPLILKQYQEKYGYELILNSTNKGIAASLTNMIKNYAKGKYICICASDDVFMPNKVEHLLEKMLSNPSYGMCYSRSIFIDDNSDEIRRDIYPYYKSGSIFKELLCRKFHIGACNLMKREIIEEMGYYPIGIVAEDFYMNCKIAEKYEIGFVDEYLMKYRLVPVGKKRDPMKLIMSHKGTIDIFVGRPEYKEALSYWELNSAAILAPYVKYKIQALVFLVKNMFAVKDNFYIKIRIIKNIVLKWYLF